jgi:DNA-binding NtrC family response regulator
MLGSHDWSGNVRELRNVVERLCAFPDLGAGAIASALGKTGEDEASSARLRQEITKQLVSLPYHEAKERVLESFEKTYFTEHLRAASGVVTRAAQRVGLPRQSVHRMLRRLGLNSGEE